MALDVEIKKSVEIYTFIILVPDEFFIAEESQVGIVDLHKTPIVVRDGQVWLFVMNRQLVMS